MTFDFLLDILSIKAMLDFLRFLLSNLGKSSYSRFFTNSMVIRILIRKSNLKFFFWKFRQPESFYCSYFFVQFRIYDYKFKLGIHTCAVLLFLYKKKKSSEELIYAGSLGRQAISLPSTKFYSKLLLLVYFTVLSPVNSFMCIITMSKRIRSS